MVSNTGCTHGSRSIVGARHVLDASREQFLRAAAAGNQPDARFDEADVAFGRCLHAIGVHGDLASAAERHTAGRDDDRHDGGTQRHVRVLKCPDHEIDFVPVPLLRLEEKQHQVRADGKIGRLVADDERTEVLRRFLQPRVHHLDGVAADRVHLRVEFEREHAVADVDQARAGITAHDLLSILRGCEVSTPASTRGSGPLRNRVSPNTPSRSPSSNGPSGQPNPHRIARSTSSIEYAMAGATRVHIDQRHERLVQEFANLVVAGEQRTRPLTDVIDRPCGLERWQLRRHCRADRSSMQDRA